LDIEVERGWYLAFLLNEINRFGIIEIDCIHN
jgi:hypothetical protein